MGKRKMDTTTELSGPVLWSPHPNLGGMVNRRIIQSEVEGGVHLKEVAPRTVLFIRTQNRVYKMVVLDDRHTLLSGHPEYCAEPTPVSIGGSTWGGSMIWNGFIGRGMFLEFHHPEFGLIRTTRIEDVYTGPKA